MSLTKKLRMLLQVEKKEWKINGAHTKHLSPKNTSTAFQHNFVQISVLSRKTRIITYVGILRLLMSTTACCFKVGFQRRLTADTYCQCYVTLFL